MGAPKGPSFYGCARFGSTAKTFARAETDSSSTTGKRCQGQLTRVARHSARTPVSHFPAIEGARDEAVFFSVSYRPDCRRRVPTRLRKLPRRLHRRSGALSRSPRGIDGPTRSDG